MSIMDNLYQYFSWLLNDISETLSTPLRKTSGSKQNKSN